MSRVAVKHEMHKSPAFGANTPVGEIPTAMQDMPARQDVLLQPRSNDSELHCVSGLD